MSHAKTGQDHVMPGKTVLKTDWVKIGTSGATVDGREISPKAIQEMAENYDPEEYTAVINYEHYSWAGNFGSVLELKTTKNKKGEMCLCAVLAPNKEMMRLNADGQKLFTSMEIIPNFAGTGKAYLAGLALTDTPASRGTTQLNFSHRVDKEHLLSNPEEFNLNLTEDEPVPGWFTKFLSSFKPAAPAAQNPTEDDDMTPEQLATLTASIDASIDTKFAALKTELAKAPSGDGEDPAPVVKPTEAAVFSAEQATKLQESLTGLTEKFTALETKFDALSKKPTGEDAPPAGGDVTDRIY
jgi:hypothetical protein